MLLKKTGASSLAELNNRELEEATEGDLAEMGRMG
jgi:hypothetical protein